VTTSAGIGKNVLAGAIRKTLRMRSNKGNAEG